MIHRLDHGISDSTFPMLDVVPAGDFPRVSHAFALRVAGWSMYPTIQKGDRLILDPPGQVRPGDIVVFPFMDTLMCHRVIGLEARETLRTKGDAVDSPDAPIRRQDILGKVTGIIRGHGWLVSAPVAHPSPAGLMRMKIDFFRTRMRERLLGWASKSLAFLKRRTPVRMLALFVLNRYVRFYLGVRAPLQSVQAYRLMPLPNAPHGGIRTGPLPPHLNATQDVLIQARLGRHRLGTWHPSSGTMRIRQAAAGLGLEDSLRAALPAP